MYEYYNEGSPTFVNEWELNPYEISHFWEAVENKALENKKKVSKVLPSL